jgi:regulator of RNase E activity RraA
VQCGGVTVNPGDYLVADADGVVVVPEAAAERVVELLAQYADKEARMVPIINETRSMLKAIERYNRY